MVYIIPILLCIIGIMFYDRPGLKSNLSIGLWGLLLLYLVMLIGLRYKVGGDTYNYINYFEGIPTLESWEPFDLSGFEPGFSLFTSAIKTIFDDLYIYQTLISLIVTSLIMYFIKTNTEYKFLAMLLVFWAIYLYFSTEVVRESMAVAGGLSLHPMMKGRRICLYCIIVFLLATLHTSALVLLIFPLANKMRFNQIYAFIFAFFLTFCVLLFPVIQYLSQFFIFEKLLRYNEMINVGYGWKGFRFFYFALLPLLVLFISKMWFRVECKFEGIVCLQILFGFGLWVIPVIFQRLINYTIVFYLVALADIIGTVLFDRSYIQNFSLSVASIRKQMAFLILTLTIIAHSTYYIHLGFYEMFYPYHSMFDLVEEPGRVKFVSGDGE